jgi:predicted nuclease of predicted toxin-antitoxin system
MRSRRLVVDASVAGAAGTAEHPISRANRDFLEEVRRICHKVVMTAEIYREWRSHGSYFSLKWLGNMERRKKVIREPACADRGLRASISRAHLTARQQGAVGKDLPLVEAALAADRIIVSQDEEARQLFSRLAPDYRPLRAILWLRPDASPTKALEWLRRGARPVKEWLLPH